MSCRQLRETDGVLLDHGGSAQVSVRLGTTEVTPMSEDSTFMLKSQDQLQLDLVIALQQ